MKTKRWSFICYLFLIVPFISAVFLLSVVTMKASPDTVLNSPIGPCPPGEASYGAKHEGTLIVFSACDPYNDGDTMYYPHSAYEILQNGKRFKQVTNHIGDSEIPEKVTLPAGRYTVIANSENDGEVSIPVVIQTAHTTVLHLGKGYASEQTDVNPSKAVKSPTGQIIGWRSK